MQTDPNWAVPYRTMQWKSAIECTIQYDTVADGCMVTIWSDQFDWELALVLAGHVSQACISGLSADHIYLQEYDTYHGIPT